MDRKQSKRRSIVKGKGIALQAWSGPEGSRKLRFPDFMTPTQDGSKVVSQSRVVTGLLTGHNTLGRHLYLLRLIDSPLCRACGIKEETSAHILCECEALAPLRHTYLGSFFLEPEDIKSMSLGAVCGYGRATRLL